MINFKSFLTESKSAPLFHGTTFSNGISILKNGIDPTTIHFKSKLLKRSPHDSERFGTISGVSLTRSFPFAKQWSQRVIDIKQAGESYIILEFDQQMLNQNFQVKPIQYWTQQGSARIQHTYNNKSLRHIHPNEYEEFVISNKKLGTKYITKVHFFISLNEGLTPASASAAAFYMVEKLKEVKQLNPHIKFVPLPGSEVLD